MVVLTKVERVRKREENPWGNCSSLNVGTLSKGVGDQDLQAAQPHAEPAPGWSTTLGAVYLTFTKSSEQFVFSPREKYKWFVKSQETLQNEKNHLLSTLAASFWGTSFVLFNRLNMKPGPFVAVLIQYKNSRPVGHGKGELPLGSYKKLV